MPVLDTFTDYTGYLGLTIPACSASDEITVPFSRLDASGGYADTGWVRDDLKDARIAYDNPSTGWEWLPRNYSGGDLTFAAQATVAATDTTSYAIVVGNPGETTTPAAYSAPVPLDDFGDGSINATLWTVYTSGSGSVTESGGNLHCDDGADPSSSILAYDTAIADGFDQAWLIRDNGSGNFTDMLLVRQNTTQPGIITNAQRTTDFRLSFFYNQPAQKLWVIKQVSSGVQRHYHFNTSTWTATHATADDLTFTSGTWYYIRLRYDFGSGWKFYVYDSAKTLLHESAYFNDLWDTGSDDYWLNMGDPRSDTYTNSHIDADAVLDTWWTAVSGSVEAAKRTATVTESLTLDSSQTTNTTSDHAFGADQATGRRIAIPFTPTATDQYQKFSVLVRQTGATAIDARDLVAEVWSDSGGDPGVYLARARIATDAAETSVGAWQWLDIFIYAKNALTASTQYHLVLNINGSGSASQAISFGCESVGSGGTLRYQTRTASAWGSWTTDATKNGCIKVWRGPIDLASRRFSLDTKSGKQLDCGSPPSWEYDTNSRNIGIGPLTQNGGTWQGAYMAYSADQTNGDIGAVSGTSLTTLSKHDQAVLVSRTGNNTFNNTPHIYDWTPGAVKMVYRGTYVPAVGGKGRHIRHASTTASWGTPGWTDDGEITYPFPTCAQSAAPYVVDVGGTTTLVAGYGRTDAAITRIIQGELAADGSSISNCYPLCVDQSDNPSSSNTLNVSGYYQSTDGFMHLILTMQAPITPEAAGAYEFETWVCSSRDGKFFSPPYPLLARDTSRPDEYLGCYGLPGFVDDTNFMYGGVVRYAAAATRYVDVNMSLAAITVGTVPTAPSGFAASVGATSIYYYWTDNSSDEDYFNFEVSTTASDSGFSVLATTSANATGYTMSATAGTTYWTRVSAVNGFGQSGYTSVVSASISTAATGDVGVARKWFALGL